MQHVVDPAERVGLVEPTLDPGDQLLSVSDALAGVTGFGIEVGDDLLLLLIGQMKVIAAASVCQAIDPLAIEVGDPLLNGSRAFAQRFGDIACEPPLHGQNDGAELEHPLRPGSPRLMFEQLTHR